MNNQKHEIFNPKVEPSTAIGSVAKICATIGERSFRMEQINWAIRKLNSAAQHNASASKELAAAAEELAGQFGQLSASVEFFKEGNTERRLFADLLRSAVQSHGRAETRKLGIALLQEG